MTSTDIEPLRTTVVMPITFSSREAYSVFVALPTHEEMRHYEGGRGLVTASMRVSKQQPS